MTRTGDYTQVCVPCSQEGATGPGFVDLVQPIVDASRTRWVAVSDVDASGPIRPEVTVSSTRIETFPVAEYLSKIREAEQIVWASLFFCSTETEARSIRADEDYVESLSKSVFVARVVDAGYYYCYGPEQLLRASVVDEAGAEWKEAPASALDFPE